MLGLLREKAVSGVVPAGALTTGTGDRAGAFWKTFRKAVIADAQQRGLCRAVWGKRISSLLGIAALLPFVLIWAAGRFKAPDEVNWTPLGAVTFGCALAAVFLGARIAASDRQRGTDAGKEAASRSARRARVPERDGDVPRPASRARRAVGSLPRLRDHVRRGACASAPCR